MRYAQQRSAESTAAAFLERVRAAQQAFRTSQPDAGFATSLASLTRPCPGQPSAPLASADPAALEAAGYHVELRAARHAAPAAPDCHGRTTASDYYVAVFPRGAGSAGQQALAATAIGPVFVFFDGVPPLERDMTPEGLATPLDEVGAFRIP